VLVVDDANGLVDIYERWLADEFRVLTATDGQEAIGTVDDTVDIVLIDRDLEKMSGSTVVEEMRNLGHDPSVVMLSSVEPDLDVIGIEFEACLTKPVMRRDLVDAITRAGDRTAADRSDRSFGREREDDTGTAETDDGDPGYGDASGADAGSDPDDTGTEETDSSDDDDTESDVTDRLQSLRADLEETADELSRRSASGSTDDSVPVDAGDDPHDPGDASAPTRERDRTGETDDADRESGVDGDQEDEGRPRDLLPDEDDTEGGPDESLQARVERLAREATDLADVSVEDDGTDDADALENEDAD
jgi:DNA-binding response OmpR family regulator